MDNLSLYKIFQNYSAEAELTAYVERIDNSCFEKALIPLAKEDLITFIAHNKNAQVTTFTEDNFKELNLKKASKKAAIIIEGNPITSQTDVHEIVSTLTDESDDSLELILSFTFMDHIDSLRGVVIAG